MGPAVGTLVGCTLGIVIVVLWWTAKSYDRLGRIEAKVEALLRQAGLELPALAERAAREELQRGDTVAAVRAYRRLSSASLAEARAAVDELK